MKSSVLIACFTFAFAFAAEKATGAVYQNSVRITAFGGGFPADYEIEAWTQPNFGGFGAGLDVDIDQSGVMTPVNYTIGIIHAWYAVGFGTLLTPAYASTHTPFASSLTFSGGSIQTTLDVPFYLGFWLDANNSHSPELGDCFGWALLKRTTAGLTLVDNAIENQGTGIRVGTTTQVPEPGSFVVLLLSSILLVTRDRRRAFGYVVAK
jgi:hypothetical protein